MAGKLQLEIANGFVWHLFDRVGHHLSPYPIVCFFVSALEDQQPRFGQSLQRFMIIRIVGGAGIQSVFVKLQSLTRDPSGKPFFANIDIENKGLLVREIEKKRVSG